VCFTNPSLSSLYEEAYHRPPVRQKRLTVYGVTAPSVNLAIRTFFSDLIPAGKTWMPLLRPTYSERHGMSIPRPPRSDQPLTREEWHVDFLKRECSITALSKGVNTPQDTLFITSCDRPATELDEEDGMTETEPESIPFPALADEMSVDEAPNGRPMLLRGKRSMLKRTLSCTSASDLTSTDASTPATSTSNLGPIAIHPPIPNGGGAKRFKLRSSVPDEGMVPGVASSPMQKKREVVR
jgi:hypothetical protein